MPVAAPHASARRPLPRCDRTRRAPGAAADPRCGNRAAGTTLPRPPPPSPPPQRKHPLRRRPQRAVVATATTTRGRGCGAPGPGRGGCGLWRDATAAGAPMALPPPPSPPPPPPPPGGQQPDGAHRLLDDALVGALAARGNALHSPRARAILRSILLRGATRGLTRPRARRARNAGAFARDGVEEELAAGVEPRARPPRERERTACHTLPLGRALAASRQRVRGGRHHSVSRALCRSASKPPCSGVVRVCATRRSRSGGRAPAPASARAPWLIDCCCSAQPRPRPHRGLGGELQTTTGHA